VCVRVCVCMFVYMYVCLYVCVRVCMYVCNNSHSSVSEVVGQEMDGLGLILETTQGLFNTFITTGAAHPEDKSLSK
jgi:hypothetical protein